MVTATLPPFARQGSEIDATVSALGDAKSLLGGTLLVTPLLAADGEVYAVAQGTLTPAASPPKGDAESVTRGRADLGRDLRRGHVEQEVDFALDELRSVRLALRNPDFTTALRIASAINGEFGRTVARVTDHRRSRSRAVIDNRGRSRPSHRDRAPSRNPDHAARVVIDQRSGIIVVGADVRISEVAVGQGNLTVRVTETPQVSQPNPFGQGRHGGRAAHRRRGR